MGRLRMILGLTLLYLALTANLGILNVVIGVLVATAVTFLLPHHATAPVRWREWPAALWALIRYILMVMWDLLVSGIQVARIVLSPQLPIQPGIIAIPSETHSDLATALSAHAITLTPGQLVVEIDADGVMYTHCLEALQAAAEEVDAQVTRRRLLEKIIP